MSTQKNCFNETVLLSTQNICYKLKVRKYLQFYADNSCLVKLMFLGSLLLGKVRNLIVSVVHKKPQANIVYISDKLNLQGSLDALSCPRVPLLHLEHAVS